MHLLITGGCGYVGTLLVSQLIKEKHRVRVVDNQWFGNYLPENTNLENIKEDIRNLSVEHLKDIDTVIHLANIANDPSVKLNELLSWEVNVLATQQLADLSLRSGVKHFIYASSGSVYGIKDEKNVTEDLELVPISAYNKTKMVSERILISYKNEMKVHCIRPATVCGYSPRMRLDLTVNMLTFQALKNKEIKVFGGDQIRPNIHIKDMVAAYMFFLNHDELPSGFYNAGFENLSVLKIAEKINKKINSDIKITSSNDKRSYRLDSSKLIAKGFEPKYSINDAIEENIKMYKNKTLVEKKSFYNVGWMEELNI